MTEATSESGVFYNSGHGFRPIGLDDDRCFIGCFEGNNHRIVGLKSDYPDEDYVGLFDFCYNSTIMDLELVDINIFGKSVGGFTSSAFYTRIFNCQVTGTISPTNNALYCAGGIAGYITNSGIQCCVSGVKLTNPYLYSGWAYSIGGVAGEVCDDKSIINMCYFSGSLIEHNNDTPMGGIAARNRGSISDCFNVGYIENPNNTQEGGISGFNAGIIERCYNIGNASSPISNQVYSGSCSDCIYLKTIYNSDMVIPGALAKTYSEMKQKDCYSNYNFSDTWKMENESLPVLKGLPFIYVNSFVFNRPSLTLDINGSVPVKLEYKIGPDDTALRNLIWQSSDPGIVKVEDGVVTGLREGVATITANSLYGNAGDTCTVTVGIPVKTVSLDRKTGTIIVGYSMTLTAAVSPLDANYPEVTWSSDNTAVATVDQTGKVTAVGVGIVTITANADGKSDTCKITVNKKGVNYVTLSSNSETLAVDSSKTLTATVSPSDATYPEVTWSSNNTAVVTVDQTGKVSAVGVGDAKIIARADGHGDTCKITVVPGTLKSSDYTVDKGAHQLRGVRDGTSVTALKIHLGNPEATVKVFDSGGTEYTGNAVGTGMSVKLIINGETLDNLDIVVAGDVSGDGRISVLDYTLCRLEILKLKSLSGLYAAAGDVNRDGGLNVSDYTLIKLDLLDIQKIN